MTKFVNVRLPEPTWKRLKALCQRRSDRAGKNISMGAIIRTAIERLVLTNDGVEER